MTDEARTALRREGIARGQRIAEINIRQEGQTSQEDFDDRSIVQGFPYWAFQDEEAERYYIRAFRDGVDIAIVNPPGDISRTPLSRFGERTLKTKGGVL